MDAKLRSRAPIRASITKTINALEVELGQVVFNKLTVKSLITKLEDLSLKVTSINQEILENLLNKEDFSEKEYATEWNAIEEYDDAIRGMKIRIAEELQTVEIERSVSPSEASNSVSKLKQFKLPKMELRKFDGELSEWLSWWAQFEKIHLDEDLNEADKFHYLVQCMVSGSRAYRLVTSYPQTKENYINVIKALQDRFGNKSLLAETYIRKLHRVMLDMSNISTVEGLSQMYDELETQLRSLDSLKVELDRSTFIVPLIEAGLPIDLLRVWQRSPDSGYVEETPLSAEKRLDALLKFLWREIKSEERIKMIQSREVKNYSIRRNQKGESLGVDRQRCGLSDKKSPSTAQSLYVGSSTCLFCDRTNHNSQDCGEAVNMNWEERNKKVSLAKACFKCLKRGHLYNKCHAPIKCVICSKSHYPVMCKQKLIKPERHVKTPQQAIPNNCELALANCNRGANECLVLMKTVQVNMKGKNRVIKARLLFDEGSDNSYVKTSTAESLGCPVVGEVDICTTLFGGVTTSVQRKRKYEVKLQSTNNTHGEVVELISEETVCAPCPKVPYGPWMVELKENGIFINDLVGTENFGVDILVGSDLWAQFMTGRMYKLSCGLIAVESVFGWTLSGKIGTKSTSLVMNTISCRVQSKKLSDLWSLEALGIADPIEKVNRREKDLLVKEQFQKEVSKDVEGRYIVRLPWTNRQIPLPSNRQLALKRLETTTTRLEKQQRYEIYDRVLQEWLDEGIIEIDSERGNNEHFLPHRPVFKPSSSTTPVRPVFDASSHIRNQPSLNQCLEKGPNLLELIPSLLVKFRLKQVGVVADIRKAFLMIAVDAEDRNYQKFFWWTGEGDNKKMIVYRNCRVVFGINSSPFILAAVVELHLASVPAEKRRTAEILKESLYVDNCVLSVSNREEYLKFRSEAVNIMEDAKMNLRQWETNIDENREQAITMVLGLCWNKREDVLYCQIPKLKEDMKVTKRNVLSVAAQIFDPIGFTSPAVLQLKMMLQLAWARNIGWDEEWAKEHEMKFTNWISDLNELEKVKIPRCVSSKNGCKNMQLHVFCDASKDAYAAAVFLRTEGEYEVNVQLLMAKSRLTPLSQSRKITIPRLELLGCVLGARLLNEVNEALRAPEVPVICWCDSSTALAWIKRQLCWGTFVSNRTREINLLVPKDSWRHVPGDMNPADLPSRGCSLPSLIGTRWWEGPGWLRDVQQWPETMESTDEDLVMAEQRKTAMTNICMEREKLRFSEYWRNVRVYGWINRFIGNLKEKPEQRKTSIILTVEEIKSGEQLLLLQMQNKYFLKGFANNLNVERGDDGLLHVKTRLTYREDNTLFKHPILLPGGTELVKQLIEFVHKLFCHAGTQFVLGKLRERYWITQGRKTVGSVINKCVVCRRFKAKRLDCSTAPLPMERVETTCAFQTTGVDLTGPIILRGGKKTWVVIYTCAVYRGVYLDLVDSLSSEEFLASLKRFTSTVGRPAILFSDCGTNFVGANSLMKTLNWEKMEKQFSVAQIKWKFNPPTAAWWGGWWERLIRTLKDLLRKMIGTAKLTRQELMTCLCEISYVMNERPLTVLNEDTEDLSPLTPAMFMRDLPVSGLPEFNKIIGKDLRNAYRKVTLIKEALKARFRKEYLANLVARVGSKVTVDPRIGDVVLVGSDNKKRFEWPLGRVIELLPGKDGKVRVCKVKTKFGTLLRPVQRLYPLEVGDREVHLSVLKNKQGVRRTSNVDDDKPPELPPLRTRRGREIKPPCYASWK